MADDKECHIKQKEIILLLWLLQMNYFKIVMGYV